MGWIYKSGLSAHAFNKVLRPALRQLRHLPECKALLRALHRVHPAETERLLLADLLEENGYSEAAQVVRDHTEVFY